MTDHEFLKHVENKTLPPAQFNHNGHIRLAFILNKQFNSAKATQEVVRLIKGYAESLGATSKFHVTLTCALCYFIFQRMERAQKTQSLAEFMAINSDLISEAPILLRSFYHEATLYSNDARLGFIPPDKQIIPEPYLSIFNTLEVSVCIP
ncbi:hypothetical protein [Marinomonas mediterranea]|jgi:hypothetical protein|uniref:Uncharacterized protein n=1 Tax=Marinomonas mediterranea (strain ATCC 700492 / JCM 21426 / NBRC 103028 / MMB-1) TaxID=717774 RepID=F2JYH6_MARM1|nr:hypothetical protein [Marinomonas mediterranea]ADZ93105.1 hypothetical protein Marme_3895 [Marinomonas mediterranea MMB-1]WCN19114.1 hypothetical protein GV053_19730 [Marinomonas mediterranea MMB-1]